MLKFITFSLLVAFISAGCGTQSQDQSSARVDNTQMQKILEDEKVQLLDVRTPAETADGIIEGAMLINFYDSDFMEKIGKLDKSKPVAIYCASGGRSATAASQLEILGFSEIYDLKAGYNGWVAEGLPTAKE